MKKKIELIVKNIPNIYKRLDLFLVYSLPKYSRSFFQKLIINQKVLVNFKVINKPKYIVFLGDRITIFIEKKKKEIAEDIPLNIIYEDKYLLILNKPSGLVVHPAPGNHNGTLLNALLYFNPIFQNIPRAGIIHRLDKNTTGLIIVAKTIVSYQKLVNLLRNRQIIREYETIVSGNVISGGTINVPIMRHIHKRTCMMTHASGKFSITHYRIIKKFKYYTHLKIRLETGRTHQIRVHMLHINHPILGDNIYKNRNHIPKGINQKIFDKIQNFPRQALHASKVKFFHPITNYLINCQISLPYDILNLIEYL